MIPDWETNHLFVSDRLGVEFPALLSRVHSAFQGVSIEIISDTADIWCRDYMPIQLTDDSFCQFVYSPDYLRGFEHSITPPDKCRLPFMEDCRQEPIVLDGGNVVASRTRVILTDKVFTENPSIKRPRLRERLAELFQAECIFIPKEPEDEVGHSDGVVRFVAENRVLINDYSTFDQGYGAKLRTVLEKSGVEVETLPMFEEKGSRRPNELPPAVGIYINYLRVGNIVVLPEYGRPEDQDAMRRAQQVMPEATVIQVPCRTLAEKGGVLNCISWTIKSQEAQMRKGEA